MNLSKVEIDKPITEKVKDDGHNDKSDKKPEESKEKDDSKKAWNDGFAEDSIPNKEVVV
jgi:hypothetical protein